MLSIPSELARSALDAAPDAMIIIDTGGVIRYANRQVSALFGYAHDDIIGQQVELLMPERYRARHLGHRDGYIRNVRLRPMGQGLQLFGRRNDGSEFPIEIGLSPIQGGDRILTAAAIRDVTDRKRVEMEHNRKLKRLISHSKSSSRKAVVEEFELLFLNFKLGPKQRKIPTKNKVVWIINFLCWKIHF